MKNTTKYRMKENSFEFAGLVFPAPKTMNDFRTLMDEAPDLLFPYKFRNEEYDYSKIEKYFSEGPYEISKKVSLKEGDIVIDCGANMGLFSNIALAKSCEVYAFEPSETMQKCYLNKYTNEAFHIEKYALSDHSGEKIEFVETMNHFGGSHIAGIEFQEADYVNPNINIEQNRKYEVDMITLDDWAAQNNINRIDFIKADIEGAERLMLRGAVNVLRTYAPKLSICTYHFPDDPSILENIIKQANSDYVVIHKYKKLYAYVP